MWFGTESRCDRQPVRLDMPRRMRLRPSQGRPRRKALGLYSQAWALRSWATEPCKAVQALRSWATEPCKVVQVRCSWATERCKAVQVRCSLATEPCKAIRVVCKAARVLRSLGTGPYRAVQAEYRVVQEPEPDMPATEYLLWVPEQHRPGALPGTPAAQPPG